MSRALLLFVGALVVGGPDAPRAAPAGSPQDAPTAETRTDAEAARAAALARAPEELPRAAPGTWDGFFDPAGFDARVAGLDPRALAALQAAEDAYRRADLPRALERLHASLARLPDLPPAWLLLGTAYFRLQRYRDARWAFERFLAVAPGEAWRTQGLAHSYYSLGDYRAARAHYELVLERVPDSPAARRGLGLSLWRLGEDAAALATLAAASAAAPADAETQLWYGRVLFDTGAADAALPLARRAVELAGHDPRAWFLLLECLWATGADDEAERVELVWRERDRVAQERRRLEAELDLAPLDWARLRQAVDLAARVRDVDAVETLLPRLLRARPADVYELDVRLFALGTLEALDAFEQARAVARGIEVGHRGDVAAWRALEAFYARRGDREAQARAGAMRRRLDG